MPKKMDRKMCLTHFEPHPKLHTSANSNFSKHSSRSNLDKNLILGFGMQTKILPLLKLGIGISLEKKLFMQ